MDDEELEDTDSMKAFMKAVILRKLPAKLAKAIRLLVDTSAYSAPHYEKVQSSMVEHFRS